MIYRQKHLNYFHLTCFDFIGVGVSCKKKKGVLYCVFACFLVPLLNIEFLLEVYIMTLYVWLFIYG